MVRQPTIYSFGPFEFRPRTRELYKLGVKLKLRPQPMQVLQLLLDRAGDAVTREELRQSLWPADTFVDFEHGLNTSVKELRAVLSDSGTEPRYIQTLPKLGYRMLMAVEHVEQAQPGETAAPPKAASEGVPVGQIEVPSRRLPAQAIRRWPAVLGAAVALAVAL